MLQPPPISGIFPAVLTMFSKEEELDLDGTARHVEYLIGSGVHGLIAAGTSGEFIAMTEAERMQVIQLVIETAAGRVPVYAGTGHYSTRATIDLTCAAERLGASGAIVILPYYQKPPKPAIIEHFRTLRRATSLPIMLYDNPFYAGTVELSPQDVADLATSGVVQSVKSTFESVARLQDLRSLSGDHLRIFYGTFHSPLEALLGGAHGWVSGFLNFLTKDCVALYAACAAGNVPEALVIWQRLLPYKQLFTLNRLGPVNDLAIYRAGLTLLGQHGGYSRAPFYPLTDAQTAQLKELMRSQGRLA